MRNPLTCTVGGGDCALCEEMCIESADRHPEWYAARKQTGPTMYDGHEVFTDTVAGEIYYFNGDGSKQILFRRLN